MRLKVRPKIKERLKSIFMNLFGLSNNFLLGGKFDKLNIQKLRNNRKISLQKIFLFIFNPFIYFLTHKKKFIEKLKFINFFILKLINLFTKFS